MTAQEFVAGGLTRHLGPFRNITMTLYQSTWLRISYWTGAIDDGIAAISMFAQAVSAQSSSLSDYLRETPYLYAIGLAGSLMLGWTILLIWADRDPVARRGVLLMTNVVILGLMASGLFALSTGFMSHTVVVLLIAFQSALIALFTFSYIASGQPA